jgi:DNA topoisomerase-3
METAGKEVEDAELREAMKDSGIGTPATRASIIELLVNREYVEREGRSLVATEKGIQVIRLLNGHRLTSPELTGSWEHRLGLIEQGEDSRESFMRDIAKFTGETVAELDKLKGVRIERAKLGPCPICGREISENRKGYSCWSREDPGCGFVIWKKKAGKSLPVAVAKELIASLAASRERGEDPGVGRTEKAVTGFRGRSGRTFRAKLRLEQQDEGKWRVEFDEEWAKEPPKEATEEGVSADAANGGDQEEAEAPAAARAAGGG